MLRIHSRFHIATPAKWCDRQERLAGNFMYSQHIIERSLRESICSEHKLERMARAAKKKGKINSKKEFYTIWRNDLLGNRTRLFPDLESALSVPKGNISHFGIRSVGSSGGGRFEICSREELVPTIRTWEGEHIISEGLLPQHMLIQGEVCRLIEFEGFLSTYPDWMRPSLRLGGKSYKGISLLKILQDYLDSNSFEDLMGLLEMFPTSTIEFSTYNKWVGCQPRRNTIFWEVRNY